MKVKDIFKRALQTLALLGLLVNANAQNIVSGRVQTVHPDTGVAYASLTFKKVGLTRYVETDSLTGIFSTSLPSGTYDLEVRVKGAYLIQDTVFVGSSRNLFIQAIMHDSVKYEYSNIYEPGTKFTMDNLGDLWSATGTHPAYPNHFLYRWSDEDLPLKTSYIHMPERYRELVDTVTIRIASRTVKNKVVEVPQNQAKVKWFFVTQAPGGHPGETDIFGSTKNNQYSIDSAHVWIDTTLNTPLRTIYKEWGRVWLLAGIGVPEWVMSDFSTASEFHPAEYRALNTMYLLDNYTDMSIYKDTVVVTLTGVDEQSTNLPTGFTLCQNYPNPFNPSTTITFDLPRTSRVTLSVYNTLGQTITILVNEQKQPGRYSVQFDGSKFKSGVYFYRLTAGEFMETKKIVILK
jgi:hypothetical protein